MGFPWASQSISRHIFLSTKQRVLNAFLTPVGISETCQSLRSVTGHDSGPTWFAVLTWSWFTPVKSSVLFGIVLWNSLAKGKHPLPLLYLKEEMSPLLAFLFHHRLWRCCSSVLLSSAPPFGFSSGTVPKCCPASCLIHAGLCLEEET